MKYILGFFGLGLDSILAGLNRKVAQLEAHADKTEQASILAECNAVKLADQSVALSLEASRARRVARNVSSLIA